MSEQTTKVTLPKEVAEAIEEITEASRGHEWNIRNAQNSPESPYGIIWRWIVRQEDGVPEYFAALVNGYHVEQTSEEELREYLRKKCDARMTESSTIANRLEGRRQGVLATLDILGITIEGINEGGDAK